MRSKVALVVLLGVVVSVVSTSTLRAHCQIPCGIYDDEARLKLMLEHVSTIEKSMKQITALSGEDKPNQNQIVRWVNNKEHHADELSDTVTYYFMTQRIKPPKADADDAARKKYADELSLLHRMLVESMKAKQTTDPAHVDALRKLIKKFHNSYLGHEH